MEVLNQNAAYESDYEIAVGGLHEVKDVSFSYLFMKRLMDFVCSALAVLLLSPVLLVTAAVIRISSGRPVIYRQTRVGHGGKKFTIYKFRTMYNGAENLKRFLSEEMLKIYMANRKLADDPRITPLGKLLRSTSIDELPQLFNILKGEMSIVGPRPMMIEEVKMYGKSYDQYITVRPGLTGLWQTKGRSRTAMTDRARLDMEYIHNKSFLYDCKIMWRTVNVVITRMGAC